MGMGVWYYVKLKTISELAGGIPADIVALQGRDISEIKRKGLWQQIIAITGAKDKQEALKVIVDWDWEEVKDVADKYPIEVASQGLTVFRRDEKGRPFLKSHMIKAMIKEQATVMGYTRKDKERIHHGLWVYPILKVDGDKVVAINDKKIYLYNDEACKEIVENVDGIVELFLNVETPRGPRTSYKYSEIILPPKYIHFAIYVSSDKSNKPVITEDELKKIISEAGLTNGLGAGRPIGYGRFQLIEFKKVNGELKY